MGHIIIGLTMVQYNSILLSLFFVSFLYVSCAGSHQGVKDQPVQSSTSQVSEPLAEPRTSDLESRINALLNDSTLSSAFIGVRIISLEDSSVIYEQNSRKLFHPASNMKLLTSAAALHALPMGFNIHTPFLSDVSPVNGKLKGNLYVKGFGDPLVTSDDLDSVAKTMAGLGMKEITGDIIGDVSAFDSLVWGKGWMWDDEPSTDEAFFSPLSVNGNSLRLLIKPGVKIGSRVRVIPEIDNGFFSITNLAVTSTDTAGKPVRVSRMAGRNEIIISGTLHPSSPSKEKGVSLWNPGMYFLSLLRDALQRNGIAVSGGLQFGAATGNVELAGISHPIDSILAAMNKHSDNLAAEQLLKTLAINQFGQPGSAERGLGIVKEYCSAIGLDTLDMILADGSGVSWYNAISPFAITFLLQREYEQKETFRRFYESMAVAGIDGTLKNRMKWTPAQSNVHAKTGSLTGASAISGYVSSADGKMMAFSVLCNHFPRENSYLRQVQDRLLEMLASYSFASP